MEEKQKYYRLLLFIFIFFVTEQNAYFYFE
ncbi:MAG: Unknown protein [uncultured Aureispira sp.]|uniref:Uncharacterized protein n=1 Tax=uncultured Aureispira sp. TaxID=1331704 RepID=A0A6S6RUC8_9BACT|nr:MAG: Unknown protein [uncultured Aureispira sp.]